jgi:hypothetical protein
MLECHCTFVQDWNDPVITANKLRIFGKKAAVHKEENQLLAEMKKKHFLNMITVTATDYESTPEGNWIKATKATSDALSRVVKEPMKLSFSQWLNMK